MWALASQKLPEGGLARNPIKLHEQSGPWSSETDRGARAAAAATYRPTVSTCHNTLRLPPYGDREKLGEMLRCALLESEGFHLT